MELGHSFDSPSAQAPMNMHEMFSRAEGDELVDFLPGADYRHRTDAAERIRSNVEHPYHPGAVGREDKAEALTSVVLGAPIPPTQTLPTISLSDTPTSSLGVLEKVMTRSRSFDEREVQSSLGTPSRPSLRHRHSITGSPEVDRQSPSRAGVQVTKERISSERSDSGVSASAAAPGILTRTAVRNVPSSERRPHTSLASSSSHNILGSRGLGSRRSSTEGLISSVSTRGSSASRLALRYLPPPAPPPKGPLPIPPASERLPARAQRNEDYTLPSRTRPVPIPQIVEPSSLTIQQRRRDDQAVSNPRMRLSPPLVTSKPLPSIPGTLATPSPLELPPLVALSVPPETRATRSTMETSSTPSTPAFYTPVESDEETSFDTLFFRPVVRSAPPTFGGIQRPSGFADPSRVALHERSGPNTETASVETSSTGEQSGAVSRRGVRPRTPATDLSGSTSLRMVSGRLMNL